MKNMKQLWVMGLALLTLCAVLPDLKAHETPPPPPVNPGTGTPGFWKNHPEAWPVQAITVGGVNYTIPQAIAVMNQSTSRDKTYNLAEQLIAAKLNVLIGNDSSCIADTIANADAFLTAFPVGSGVRASSLAWQTLGADLLATLDAYNNGELCAPSRD